MRFAAIFLAIFDDAAALGGIGRFVDAQRFRQIGIEFARRDRHFCRHSPVAAARRNRAPPRRAPDAHWRNRRGGPRNCRAAARSPGLRAKAGAALADAGIEQIRQRIVEHRHIRPRRLGAGRLGRVFLRMLCRIALVRAFRHRPQYGSSLGSEESAPVIPDCRESGSPESIFADLRLWIRARRFASPRNDIHSNLMPARSITSPHFLESDAISAANSSGVPPAGSSPMAAKRAWNAARLDRPVDRGVELVDDRLRHAGRRDDAGPGRRRIAGHAGLGDGRQQSERPASGDRRSPPAPAPHRNARTAQSN